MKLICFFSVLVFTMSARAEIKPEFCESDRAKFCDSLAANSPEAWNCLKEKSADLLEDCRIQLGHYEFHQVCKKDLAKLCTEKNSHRGYQHACILKAREKKKSKLTTQCREFIDGNQLYFQKTKMSSHAFC